MTTKSEPRYVIGMYDFHKLDANDLVLDSSPLVRALDFLAAKFDGLPNGIPLTKSLALKRDLVAEAIFAIQWPDWTEERIYGGYAPVKVADEYHFQPFLQLHQHLLDLKMVRHFESKLLLTKAGKTLLADRFTSFDRLVRYVLFEDPHRLFMRQEYGVFGNWDVWLNVMDIETTHGASGRHLTETFYGAEDEPNEFDPRTSRFHSSVLEPLIFCGLLDESRENGRKLTERVYSKSQLWQRYLQLDEKPPMLRVVH